MNLNFLETKINYGATKYIESVKLVKTIKHKNGTTQDKLDTKIDNNHNQIFLTNNGVTKILTYADIKEYINNICQKMNAQHLNVDKLANNVYPKLKNQNTIKDVEYQITTCASEMVTDHYDYPAVAVWILINNLHSKTHDDYLKVAEQLYYNVSDHGKNCPIISTEFYQYVKNNYKQINQIIRYERDYNISIFGYRTLEKSYLKKTYTGEIIERPQHLFMRVAIALHFRTNSFDKIAETYELLSQGYFTHATPTLFNAGTIREQLSSCFLLGIEDSMDGIGDAWKDCAIISKFSGGIGINVTNIRVDGAYIGSSQTRGAKGLKLLLVFNQIIRYADQGGKRPGSVAFFIEPWHGDIYYFLDLKKNTGAETERARDIFLGLMINDIFMQRILENGVWSLMCPASCPELLNKYGEEFTKTYLKYEAEGNYLKQVSARDLWFKIMESQIETGVPYILFKDAINYKSNQINIGVVNGSNLCCEIVEVSSASVYSVCNLASICLPKFVECHDNNLTFNYQELCRVTRIITRNLNNIIDINYYPLEKTKSSNFQNRPIGIGVQGLADVFAMFKTPFDSELARDLNKKIFETIYYGALLESMKLAKKYGPYETFKGSPLSQGKFQFDLWGLKRSELSGFWDWNALMMKIRKYGVRNSLVTTCMPTASTSQIMNNNECIEPYTENIYTRSTLAGDYYVINKHLMKDLMELDLWNEDMVDLIKYYRGSVAKIPTIPDNIKKIYRTVWEIPQKSIIDMAADRAPFIDQTQSMNIFINKPNFARLNSCLFHAWHRGLKTGMYYLRSKAASEASQFGIDMEKIKKLEKKYNIEQNSTLGSSGSQRVINVDNLPVCRYVPKHLRKSGDCLACGS